MRQAKIIMVAVLLAGITYFSGAHANAQTTEAEIFAKLVDKPLFLMGLWADDKLKFDAQGHPAANYKLAPFTVCGMHVAKVSLRGNHLKIEGEREGITFDKEGTMTRITTMVPNGMNPRDTKPEKLTVEIDNGSSKDFGPALDAVFTEDPKRLAPALPDFWQWYFKQKFGAQPTQVQPESPRPAQVTRPTPTKGGATHLGAGVRPPKVLHTAEPEFSEYARRLKLSGNVQVYLWVDEDGNTSHVRIVKPVGFGLDEKAVAAVKQYRFAPATRDGVPVKVDLYIDVNFQIF